MSTARNDAQLDEGITEDQTRWTLGRSVDDKGGRTIWIAVTTALGARFKGGYGSPSLTEGVDFSTFQGQADGVPVSTIVRVRRTVESVRAVYSDGSTEVVRLVPDPDDTRVLLGAHVCSGSRTVSKFDIQR
ncbi:hypothetical protein GCM10009858_31550 [Terrabacter carboxydivorans]|uniref:Head-tail adaptor protein n=1 Tax=Terrabacter carboxydivorans TaxID=619730 RepID=A0ABN3LVU6_9MICO